MERSSHRFKFKHANLHYTKYGVGEKFLFCFHGFGLTGEAFFELEEVFSKEYTIYNFDLFFHGKSEWHAGDKMLTPAFCKELFSSFLSEQKINQFSLLGYSIGARIVWTLVLEFKNQVKEIIVLAPDGITISNWFKIATRTLVNRKLFKYAVLNHHRIHSIMKAAHRFKLAPTIAIRFAEGQLATAVQRERVYYTWVVYRKLKADNKIISKIINENSIPFTLYLGELDKIITEKKVKPLVDLIDKASVVTIESGHSNLISGVKEYLKANSNETIR